MIVGLLSLLTPAVWGNGYSVVQSYLLSPPLLTVVSGIFICKLLAVLASSGSGAPGGVFTPTLFVGLVAHARAVGSGIIVAEHAHLFELAYGNLCDIRREIVWYAAGVLAYQPALVRADGVEVP